MRSRLLTREFFEALISAPSLQQLIQDLHETEYGPDLEDALIHGRDAASVDEALKNNIVRTYRKVLGFLNDEGAYIISALLGRWDVFNIKTVLRGVHMHLAPEQIAEGLLPVGQLSVVDLGELARLEDVRGVVETAFTWGLPYASAMREGHAKFLNTGELSAMESSLDRYYTQWAAKQLQKRGANMEMARRILGIQVDIVNLLMVLRMQRADVASVDTDSFFLEGGRDVSRELCGELFRMSDVDQVLDRLRGTPYGNVLDGVATQFLEANSIAVFERALEDYLMRKALALSTTDALGVGVAISYLWAKQNEVTNLRIIVKGMAVGMPVERVRGELILV